MPMTNPGKFDSNGAWDGFRGEIWQEEINVRDFIQKNYTPYDGDETFLEGATESTEKLWNRVQELQKQERAKGGVLECETDVVSGLTAYGPGYISEELKDLEQIVGLGKGLTPSTDDAIVGMLAIFYAAGNVRITFDWNVRTTMYHQKFLEEKVYDVEAVQCPGEMIMEVKYDAFLPRVIQDLIQMDGVRQQSFSKYGACRNYG